MILSDKTIKNCIDDGRIKFFPEIDLVNIRPTGIRLHLADELLVPRPGQTVDLSAAEDIAFDRIKIGSDGFILHPNQFVLGSTQEKFQVSRNMVCHIEGRSTIARIGLAIHCTSGIIDGNFDEARTIVLEMKNQGPFEIILRPAISLAMLTFSWLTTDIAQSSQKQYHDQSNVLAPNFKRQKS